jgi:hypothetical protein
MALFLYFMSYIPDMLEDFSLSCRLIPQCTPDSVPVRYPAAMRCPASAGPLTASRSIVTDTRCDTATPLASIWLGLRLAKQSNALIY